MELSEITDIFKILGSLCAIITIIGGFVWQSKATALKLEAKDDEYKEKIDDMKEAVRKLEIKVEKHTELIQSQQVPHAGIMEQLKSGHKDLDEIKTLLRGISGA